MDALKNVEPYLYYSTPNASDFVMIAWCPLIMKLRFLLKRGKEFCKNAQFSSPFSFVCDRCKVFEGHWLFSMRWGAIWSNLFRKRLACCLLTPSWFLSTKQTKWMKSSRAFCLIKTTGVLLLICHLVSKSFTPRLLNWTFFLRILECYC